MGIESHAGRRRDAGALIGEFVTWRWDRENDGGASDDDDDAQKGLNLGPLGPPTSDQRFF